MKIAIDARLYGLEHAGIGRYVMNLINQLSEIDHENEYHILLRKEYYDMLDLPKNWKKHLADIRHYSIKEQIIIPKILNTISPDITHFPHFNIPIRYKKPFIVTIHDLSKHRSKSKDTSTLPYHAFLLKRITYYRVIRTAVVCSKNIIVPTEAVKKDILEHYHIPESKVSVVYEGVDLFGKYEKSKTKKVFSKYGLAKPYFIFTGNAYPHKNVPRLIEAVVLLNKEQNIKCMLGLSSSRSIFTSRIEELIKTMDAEKYVKLLGFVPDDDLRSLYSDSVGFVYPSLMEGFGLPGLEAMQAGTIALVSDIPVFHEVYKNHVYYFNPFDYTAIASCMKQILEMNSDKRKTMITNGKDYIKKFDWKLMANETLEVYKKSAKAQ